MKVSPTINMFSLLIFNERIKFSLPISLFDVKRRNTCHAFVAPEEKVICNSLCFHMWQDKNFLTSIKWCDGISYLDPLITNLIKTRKNRLSYVSVPRFLGEIQNFLSGKRGLMTSYAYEGKAIVDVPESGVIVHLTLLYPQYSIDFPFNYSQNLWSIRFTRMSSSCNCQKN